MVMICVIDVAVAPIYLLLTLTVLASFVSPFLRDLASHGKTRKATAVTTRSDWGMRTMVDQFLHEKACLVYKRRFLHFYVAGVISSVWLLKRQKTAVDSFGTDKESTRSGLSYQVAIALLLSHLVRRSFECCYVHVWSPRSIMHIGGYCLGIVHYILLSLVFVPQVRECGWLYPNASMQDSQRQITYILIGATFCLVGQYEQYRHHCILASLRQTRSIKENVNRVSPEYTLPTGRWFQWVSCPHYLAEVLIYIGFTILLNPLYAEQRNVVNDDSVILASSLSNMVGEQTFRQLVLLNQHRHLIVLLWVTCNLSVSALQSHEWYVSKFPSCQQRKAIIPFLV